MYQKILKLDETPSQQNDTNNNLNNNPNNNSSLNNLSQTNSSSTTTELNGANSADISTKANRTIELICSDQVNIKFSFFICIKMGLKCFILDSFGS